MTRAKNSLNEDEMDRETEMAPGSKFTQDDLDDFDPGVLLGLNDIIPMLPNIPGYHVSWAAVPSEAINDASRWIKALQLGYRPITPEEFQHYSPYNVAACETTQVRGKNNQFIDAIKVMDVVAVKIPVERYARITKYLEENVLRTEADLQRRPVHNLRDTRYSQIEVEGRPNIGHSTNLNDAFDKI